MNINTSEFRKFKLFDSHCHYDHPRFGDERYAIVDEVYRHGIDKLVIPAIGYETNFTGREMFRSYPWIYFAAGVHPKTIHREPDWDEERTEKFYGLLKEERTVAIGEAGLDYSLKEVADHDRQKRFFRMFMDMAKETALPLVLHVRDAEKDSLEVLKDTPLKTEAVLHCFGGNYSLATEYMHCGVRYFGVGGRLTRDEEMDLADAVAGLPIENILLETDAPFIRPKGFTGNNTSLNLPLVVKRIAEIKNMSEADVARITYQNACTFYKVGN